MMRGGQGEEGRRGEEASNEDGQKSASVTDGGASTTAIAAGPPAPTNANVLPLLPPPFGVHPLAFGFGEFTSNDLMEALGDFSTEFSPEMFPLVGRLPASSSSSSSSSSSVAAFPPLMPLAPHLATFLDAHAAAGGYPRMPLPLSMSMPLGGEMPMPMQLPMGMWPYPIMPPGAVRAHNNATNNTSSITGGVGGGGNEFGAENDYMSLSEFMGMPVPFPEHDGAGGTGGTGGDTNAGAKRPYAMMATYAHMNAAAAAAAAAAYGAGLGAPGGTEPPSSSTSSSSSRAAPKRAKHGGRGRLAEVRRLCCPAWTRSVQSYPAPSTLTTPALPHIYISPQVGSDDGTTMPTHTTATGYQAPAAGGCLHRFTRAPCVAPYIG